MSTEWPDMNGNRSFHDTDAPIDLLVSHGESIAKGCPFPAATAALSMESSSSVLPVRPPRDDSSVSRCQWTHFSVSSCLVHENRTIGHTKYSLKLKYFNCVFYYSIGNYIDHSTRRAERRRRRRGGKGMAGEGEDRPPRHKKEII